MLAIGRALVGEPRLLLVDEASLGLAPMIAREIFDILARINREKKLAILVVEQNVSLALKHAAYGYVLENGAVVLQGAAAELADRELVSSRYLGGHAAPRCEIPATTTTERPMKYEMFRLDVADGIATVTFDRPPVNAQNRQSREEAIHLFDALSDRDDVRCVILTSALKAFSAGADVKERVGLVQQPGDYVRHNRLTREYFYAITDCAKPVIAAVNGAAFGAGFVLALSCDIVIASEDAYFVMPELDVGLAGGAGFLMQHFSRSMARYMYFTARKIPAAELHRLGVITAVLPPDRLMAEARAIATEIAAKSPGAVTRGEAFVQRRGGDADARCLPLRADHHGRPVEDRGHQGSAARLRREAQAEVHRAASAIAAHRAGHLSVAPPIPPV